MPWLQRPPCSQPRCPDRATHRGRCERHRQTTSQRGYGWAHQRERAAALPGARCVRCGATTALERNHIVPRSLGGSDEAGNREWLCGPCHDRFGARRGRPGRPVGKSGRIASSLTRARDRVRGQVSRFWSLGIMRPRASPWAPQGDGVR